MKKNERIGLGLIGCGRFGRFCLKAFSQSDRTGAIPIAAAHVTAGKTPTDSDLPVPVLGSPEELLSRGDVDLVHVATPPSTHAQLVLMALRAGKHVLCEKPLALTVGEADEVIAATAEGDRTLAVSFLMRYSPVAEAAKAVIDSGAVGRVLAGTVTNCGSDSGLGPEHWFWDKNISGGIFVEHVVHFFDLYRYWLGPGEVLIAHARTREGTEQEDRVSCTVRHRPTLGGEGGGRGALVTHYHSFDQVPLMERTEHRLVCEMGDIRVGGWVPLSLEVDAAVDDAGAARLAECRPGSEIETLETYSGDRINTTGRGEPRRVTRRIRLRFSPRPDKQVAYAEDMCSLLGEQVDFIRDRRAPRRVTEADGREALVLAEQASRLAERSTT